ncbi:hypothetical protein ACVXG9_10995 [Escherichia coli]
MTVKNVPGVGGFAGENGNSTTGDAIYIVVPIPLTVFNLMAFAISAASRATPSIPSRSK